MWRYRTQGLVLAFGAFISIAWLAGCAGMLVPPSEIGVAKADIIIRSNYGNPELGILDVRTPREYEEGHIEKAFNIPVESASFRNEADRLARGRTYIVYCREGKRSTEARNVMLEMGFTKVVNMSGGILEWKKAGFRVVKEEE